MKKFILSILLFAVLTVTLAAQEAGADLTELMTNLVLQIGIILFAARAGGMLMRKLGMPQVLGELLAGILIGPYLLGSIALPGFPEGIFPAAVGSVPVSPELYGIATVASIILLFISGLETDLSLFLRFSVAGAVVGIGGVVASFGLGAGIGSIVLGTSFMDPRNLFLGVMSTATSVGITARILSDKKKMDSPEGVTILAAAVIDDVLGIIILAVVLGIVAVAGNSGEGLPWANIAAVAAKAFGVWLGFTALGLVFARRISAFLKIFRNVTTFSVLSLGLALILAGVFEKTGLAMIIGAYVMGLSLSKTDISYVIQEHLHPVYEFFVPVFFTVMGMLVNLGEMLAPATLLFGLIYTAAAIVAKVVGCGIPSLFLNFNRLGAFRIGVGMIPRGEVALIIAGIGISGGLLSAELFGVSIMMTLVSTIVAPPLLSGLLSRSEPGTRIEMKGADTVTTEYRFESEELTDLVGRKVVDELEREGFFMHRMEVEVSQIYHVRKDDVSFSIVWDETTLTFESAREDVAFVKTLMYEMLLDIHDMVEKLSSVSKPPERIEAADEEEARTSFDIAGVLDQHCIVLHLHGTTKEEIITELVDVLAEEGKLKDRAAALEAVFEREQSMSTGMQDGIALPHGKTDGVDAIQVAVGLKPEGIEFQSLDGKPSRIFILVVSPKRTTGPHIQFLATISAILKSPEAREQILLSTSRRELWEYIVHQSKAGKNVRR
jgi:Kef-type K+ transport system membrane component KefB/mannitol/fructose-specific phosphotransferase system IIA component (Ntr-type)